MTDTYVQAPQSQLAAAPQSQLAAAPESTFTQPSSLLSPDVDRIDRNLRRVNLIENAWRLPKLPNMVKMDLIQADGADEDSLTELLFGLDDDLNRPDSQPDTSAPMPQQVMRSSGIDQARVLLAAMTSNPAPRETSGDAVKAFKLRAIERGMLDQDPRRVDNSWSPEFNRMRGQMAFDDYNQQMRGDRPGAMPMSSAMKLLNDLTSPAGLLSVATDLDLFWDFGAIGREYSSWGDKWRQLGEAKNPLDWAGKLVDAVTGPIDDVVFPVINVALLFAGVGAIANSARVGWQGARLAEGAGFFSKLWSGGRFGRFAESIAGSAGRNLTELSRASSLADRFRKGAIGIERGTEAFGELGRLTRTGAAVGDKLAEWRALRPVVAAKSTVQQGMRLGFAGVVEDRFPGYQGGGASLSDIGAVDTAGDWLYRASQHPGFMPLELMFAPYNIFSPGTFFRHGTEGVGLLGGAGRAAFGALGTTGGRAAAGALGGAAIGTMAGDDAGDIARGAVIGAGGAAALPVIGRVIQTERIHQGLTGALLGGAVGAMLGDSPEDIAVGALAGTGVMVIPRNIRQRIYDQAGIHGLDNLLRGVGHSMVRSSFRTIERDQQVLVGFHKGMQRRLLTAPEELAQWNTDVDTLGVVGALAKRQGGDAELAAATITFGYTSAAIEFIASAQAAMIKGERGRQDGFRMARNKLVNQLRPIDLARPVEDIANDVAKALAWAERGGAGGNLARVYERQAHYVEQLAADPSRVAKLAKQHNDQIGDTITQLFDQRNFPRIDDAAIGHTETARNVLGDTWATTPMRSRAEVFTDYAPRYFDSIGDFGKFTSSAQEVRNARLGGLFDAAKLKPVTNRRGRLVNPLSSTPVIDPASTRVNRAINDLLVGGRIDMDRLGDTRLTPLAGAHEPGRITMMRVDEATKQDLETWAEQVADVVDTNRLLVDQKSRNWLATINLAELDQAIDAGGLTDRQIVEMAKQAAAKGANKKQVRKLLAFAGHHGVKPGNLDRTLNEMADALAQSEQWEKLGFARTVFDERGHPMIGVTALERRLGELRARIPYTAAEIDVDELVRYYDAAGDTVKSAQMRELADGLAGREYKLVHGTEFLMPEDLAFHTPTFKDITRRHLNAVSLGNFFERRPPVEAMIRDDRRRRLALVHELDRAGHTLTPDDPEIDNILGVLERWLRGEQEDVGRRMGQAHLEPKLKRTFERVVSSFTPIRLDDVAGFSKNTDKVRAALRAADLPAEQVDAVVRALNRFRNSDFQDVGVYGIEAYLRGKSAPAGLLKMLGGTRYGNRLIGRAGGQAVTGAAIGAVAGVATADTDASFEDKLKRALTGGAIGGAAGAGLAAGVTGLDNAADIIQRTEDLRYGYLSDGYARLRDSMRFTLSPFFDLSRYTEGLFLAQTAAPTRHTRDVVDAAGNVIHKAGDRIVIPLNMSPRGLRKRIQRQLGEGATDVEARAVYQQRIGEFNAAAKAKGDFDADAIDATGKWFRQVGVLGFSPVDWMGTAYTHLRTQGLGAEEAYEAARGMYNYGTRGRSAGEMSANFIFFPFSFQKKALGHMGRWLNDDLGRSIILHDAFKTYEALDERFNLDEYWKDHIPFLTQLQRLNLFAYGISPGRFGGINSQLFEGVGKLAWNAFIPVGTNIRDVSAGRELQALGRQMLPVWNDINWMMHDVREVAMPVIAGAVTPMAAVSFDAQVRRGYDEWYAFKRDFETAMVDKGYTTADVFNKPWLADAKMVYEQKMVELAGRYPAWFASRQEVPGNLRAIEMERDLRVNRARFAAQAGQTPTLDDQQVAEMQSFIEGIQQQAQLATGSTNLDEAPPAVFDAILERAAEMARRNPSFTGLWNKFWRRTFGVIDLALEM